MKILWVFLFIVIMFVAAYNNNIYERFDVSIYDLVVRPQSFDLVNISDAMSFKERKSDEIKTLLVEVNVDTKNISREEALDILRGQLGNEYDIVFWKENDTYYDIVVQAPGKMYGILLLVKKAQSWAPRVIGYIFDDKINMLFDNI